MQFGPVVSSRLVDLYNSGDREAFLEAFKQEYREATKIGQLELLRMVSSHWPCAKAILVCELS